MHRSGKVQRFYGEILEVADTTRMSDVIVNIDKETD